MNATLSPDVYYYDEQELQIHYDDQHIIPLIILSVLSSSLSILGSTSVAFMAQRENAKKRQIMQRLLFCLSLADLGSSLSLLIMPFAAPKEEGLAGAVGNHASCAAVGFFFLVFLLMGCILNCFLSLYFLLVVRRNWREHHFTRGGELLAYAIAIGIPLAFCIPALTQQAINTNHLIKNFCTFGASPWECRWEEDTCQRSSRDEFQNRTKGMAFTFVLFSLTGFVATILVYCKARHTFRRSRTFRFKGSSFFFLKQQGSSEQQQQQQQGSSRGSSSGYRRILGALKGVRLNPDSSTPFGTSTHMECSNQRDLIDSTEQYPSPIEEEHPIPLSAGGEDNEQVEQQEQQQDTMLPPPRKQSSLLQSTAQSIGKSLSSLFQHDHQDEKTRQVAIQAILYSLVYLNTILWPALPNVLSSTENDSGEQTAHEILADQVANPGYYVLHILVWTFLPLQGFCNFFVYSRVRVKEWKRINPEATTFHIYRLILLGIPIPRSSTAGRDSSSNHNNNRKNSSNNSAGATGHDPTTGMDESEPATQSRRSQDFAATTKMKAANELEEDPQVEGDFAT